MKYSDDLLKNVEEMASSGLSQLQIANALGINEATLYKWKKSKPKFRKALLQGQGQGVKNIANALYNAAISGNVQAQKFFLLCRAGWRENEPVNIEVKQEVNGIDVKSMSNEELEQLADG